MKKLFLLSSLILFCQAATTKVDEGDPPIKLETLFNLQEEGKGIPTALVEQIPTIEAKEYRPLGTAIEAALIDLEHMAKTYVTSYELNTLPQLRTASFALRGLRFLVSRLDPSLLNARPTFLLASAMIELYELFNDIREGRLEEEDGDEETKKRVSVSREEARSRLGAINLSFTDSTSEADRFRNLVANLRHNFDRWWVQQLGAKIFPPDSSLLHLLTALDEVKDKPARKEQFLLRIKAFFEDYRLHILELICQEAQTKHVDMKATLDELKLKIEFYAGWEVSLDHAFNPFRTLLSELEAVGNESWKVCPIWLNLIVPQLRFKFHAKPAQLEPLRAKAVQTINWLKEDLLGLANLDRLAMELAKMSVIPASFIPTQEQLQTDDAQAMDRSKMLKAKIPQRPGGFILASQVFDNLQNKSLRPTTDMPQNYLSEEDDEGDRVLDSFHTPKSDSLDANTQEGDSDDVIWDDPRQGASSSSGKDAEKNKNQ